jgi:uncharacterized protein (TIGR02217 family)
MPIEFDEVELNRMYSPAAHGGPVFSTSIYGNPFGYRQRNINQFDAIHVYEFDFEGQREGSYFEELVAFFMTRKGRAIGFRFFPFDDNSWINNQIGTYATGTATYPLYKRYAVGSRTYERRILKPNNDLVVAVGGVPVSASVNTATGHITISGSHSHGAAITVTSGTFCIPVTFNTDKMDRSSSAPGYFNFNGLSVVEILAAELGLT